MKIEKKNEEMLGSFFSSNEVLVDVSGRGLTTLPEEELSENTTAIVAKDNQIVALPGSLRSLTGLTRLDLDGNRLRHLPNCIYHMTTLTSLSVRHNDLTKLEPEIVHMRKLRTLALDGNPLAFPPAHIAMSMKPARLFEWIQKHPSYQTFRFYRDARDHTTSFLDLNIGTAHAQVKATKKNEDRWTNAIILADDSQVQVKHIDLDDPSLHFRQGNLKPNKSNVNVYHGKSAFIGMYDGHGGNAASGALQQNMLKLAKSNGLMDVSGDDDNYDWDSAFKELFVDIDTKLCDALVGLKKGAGSTCTVALILVGEKKVKLVMAHVGDSRAVAGLTSSPGHLELTKDHSPHDAEEKLAVEARGGKIARKREGACLRVNGDLNMTRSMGDVKWKRPQSIISCVPDVKVYEMDPTWTHLVIASDGLWCYINNEMASNYAKDAKLAEESARAMVAKIKSWIEGTSHKGDNTSVTVVKLAWNDSCRKSAKVEMTE